MLLVDGYYLDKPVATTTGTSVVATATSAGESTVDVDD